MAQVGKCSQCGADVQASATVCPACGTMFAAPPALPILVREYADAQQFQLDAAALAMQGYEVFSSTQQEQRPGCLAIVTLGLLALLFKPKARLVVTYRLRGS